MMARSDPGSNPGSNRFVERRKLYDASTERTILSKLCNANE